MRNVVIGLAVLSGIATVIAVHFLWGAHGLAYGSLIAGDGHPLTLATAYEVSSQLGATAALAAVILGAASCLVEAIGDAGRLRP